MLKAVVIALLLVTLECCNASASQSESLEKEIDSCKVFLTFSDSISFNALMYRECVISKVKKPVVEASSKRRG